MIIKPLLSLTALFVAFSATASDLKINLKVERFVLANGLTVLLHEDHSIPSVSYHTWYRVGSKEEKEGVTGAAHMLEHMMFKGAKKYGLQDFDRLMHENGISHNAFTTNDYTGFYQNLPPDKLELVMDIEVDRMSALTLNSEELLRERDVVKEERRWRIDNNPSGVLREATMSTVFQVHPYRWPVIGTMKDISDYNAEKLRYFYETFYVPNNAVLVIAGDIDVSKTKELVKKYYSSLPAKKMSPPPYEKEPTQKTARTTTKEADVQSVTMNISYQGVAQGHDDMYALDLLSGILGEGSSSRIYKNLVQAKGLATSAFAYHMSLKDHGLFSVGMTLKPGADSKVATDLVLNEIYRIRTKGIQSEELKKAKIQVMGGIVDGLQTIDSKARALAASEIVTGSYETLFSDIEKYNQVTLQDIQRVALKYLNSEMKSTVTLVPKVGRK